MKEVGRLEGRFTILFTLAALVIAWPITVSAQTEAAGVRVRTVVDTLYGGVGGLAVDRAGNIYVADFGDHVWKVKPDGRKSLFADGLYGASGNAIDAQGNLFQASFYGNYISKIDRSGKQEVYLEEGLNGPVGIAVDGAGNLFVNNCSANTVKKVTAEREVTTFAEGPLFNCPNGITFGPQGNLYVVNFGDERMIKITPEGDASEFATLPGGGNGHVALARGSLYATSFQGHRLYNVSLTGDVTLIAGNGNIGEADGPGSDATFSWPNGIAANPIGDRVYVNDYINRFPPTIERPPVPLSSVRQIKLASITDGMKAAFSSGGVDAMVSAYRRFKSNSLTASLFTQAEVNLYGYQLLGNGQLEAAIEVFKLNVESYPNAFNPYDSLAEAYMNAGEKKLAIEFYQKSLSLNPGNTNAVQKLAELGVN